MSNKNYPNMFDEQIANPEFLDSLQSIAKEPLTHKISSTMEPFKMLTGAIILLFYGLFRFLIEFIREPDLNMGLFFNLLSMGQLLSLPLIFFGLLLIIKKNA